MPHKCVKCSALYPDAAQEPLKGCECGSKAFYYVRKCEDGKGFTPCELATISVESDGKYHLDVERIFAKDNLIYREEEGKYRIDLEESFRKNVK